MSRKMIFTTVILLIWITLITCRINDNDVPKQQNNILGEKSKKVTELPSEDIDTLQGLLLKEQKLLVEGQLPAESKQSHEVKLKSAEENKDYDYSDNDTLDNAAFNTELKGDTLMSIGQNELVSFYYEEISEEVKKRITGKSYGDNCEIPFDELRYVKVLYWGFDKEAHEGELIVNKAIAEDIIEIFKELYEIKYPIEKMVLVDEYDADDNTSMAANNSSAFNYRNIDGTDRISIHSYGLAIDINPLYNPYVRYMDGKEIVTPTNGIEYADRELDCEYYIKAEDPLYKAFIKRGFTWGGEWKNAKDYQHFQKKPE